MGHPTHSPFEFTATGMGVEREGVRWARTVWPSPAIYSIQRIIPAEDKKQRRKLIRRIAELEQSLQDLLLVTRLKAKFSLHHGH
jgi:hypothetical protein